MDVVIVVYAVIKDQIKRGSVINMAKKMNQKLDKEIRRDQLKANLIGLAIFIFGTLTLFISLLLAYTYLGVVK